ncbi:hypothetical protein CAC42_4861 [Sphaceloma murrayae]|uniref:HMG box domain-containing protein n=1 Tax=Sphaceloma murrayae TaxID=2082308 RepID=A0A2K1QP58_9PEZI|nr:hypothetical protein CAC42_4861 [Sphaceloma murrayae]
MSAPLRSMGSPRTPTRSTGSDGRSPIHSPRKRSAELMEEPEHTDPSSPRSAVEPSPIPCLCQPEPKIPRPRNAFILYRQHHNASVIARYPNLSNPEISKIIGELWRGEPEEEKQRWKSFADEDKIQHAQKYPSYRYQPKRSNKGGHGPEGSPGPWTEVHTCPRCNGRKIAQPLPSAPLYRSQDDTSPSDPFPGSRRSNTITLPPPQPSASTTPSTRYLPMQNLTLSSPLSATYADAAHYNDAHSPKRRRMIPHHQSSTTIHQKFAFPPSPYPTHPQQPRLPSLAPAPHDRRVSLPPASDLLPRNATGMPPPSRPHGQHGHQRLIARRTPPRPDLSVNLPPLHAVGPGPGTGTATVPASAAAKSFAAAHAAQLSIGSAGSGGQQLGRPSCVQREVALVRHKIGTLRQLLLPCRLGREGSEEDAKGTGEGNRGAIIAVEGDSAVAARELADWLGDAMGREEEVLVVDGPKVPDQELGAEELLKTVGGWHEKGREIVGAVMTGQGTGKMNRERKDSKGSGGEGSEMDVDDETREERSRIVILRGYVLTATNLFAARIPITGNYDPKGHWEWTACMWRGVVAPDVIVYIKDVESKDGVDLGACEVLDEGRLIMVKRHKGDAEESGVKGVQAGALRRLGFEVGEWLRAFDG